MLSHRLGYPNQHKEKHLEVIEYAYIEETWLTVVNTIQERTKLKVYRQQKKFYSLLRFGIVWSDECCKDIEKMHIEGEQREATASSSDS